jgi:hypothetical protein
VLFSIKTYKYFLNRDLGLDRLDITFDIFIFGDILGLKFDILINFYNF